MKWGIRQPEIVNVIFCKVYRRYRVGRFLLNPLEYSKFYKLYSKKRMVVVYCSDDMICHLCVRERKK